MRSLAGVALLVSGALTALSCASKATCPLGAVDAGGGCQCPAGEAPLRDSTGEGVCVTTRYRDFVVCLGGAGLKEEAVQKVRKQKASGNVGVTGMGSVGASGEDEAVEDIKRTHVESEASVTACVDAFARGGGGSVTPAATAEPAASAVPSATAAPAATAAPPATAAPAATAAAAATVAPTAEAPTSCSIAQCSLLAAASCKITCAAGNGVARCGCVPCGLGCQRADCSCVK